MHYMRRLMTLTEAKKVVVPMSSEERDRQEQARQVEIVSRAKTEAANVSSQARKVVGELRFEHELSRWSKDWINEFTSIYRTKYQQYAANAKRDFEDDKEDNPNAKLVPVNVAECLTEALTEWWDDKKDRLEWSDAHYNLDRYLDAHRQTEMSDDITRLQAENEMLSHIRHLKGGFGSLREMSGSLDCISNYVSSISSISDNGWSHTGSTSIEIITNGIPLILNYCKTIENLK